MSARASSLLLVAAALAACEADSTRWQPTPPVDPDGPYVALREVSTGTSELRLELVGAGLTDVYGIAYRLTYDPAVLAPTVVEPNAQFWPAEPRSIHQAAIPPLAPGVLVAVMSRRGSLPGEETADAADGGTVLATIVFTRKSPSATSSIDFVAARSAVIDSAGAPLAGVTWLGGQLRR